LRKSQNNPFSKIVDSLDSGDTKTAKSLAKDGKNYFLLMMKKHNKTRKTTSSLTKQDVAFIQDCYEKLKGKMCWKDLHQKGRVTNKFRS
jgi:hypothetical protein